MPHVTAGNTHTYGHIGHYRIDMLIPRIPLLGVMELNR